jgi:hypothetical protein
VGPFPSAFKKTAGERQFTAARCFPLGFGLGCFANRSLLIWPMLGFFFFSLGVSHVFTQSNLFFCRLVAFQKFAVLRIFTPFLSSLAHTFSNWGVRGGGVLFLGVNCFLENFGRN